MSLFTPNEEEVELRSLMPELLLKLVEADLYLMGDSLRIDINKFIILSNR